MSAKAIWAAYSLKWTWTNASQSKSRDGTERIEWFNKDQAFLAVPPLPWAQQVASLFLCVAGRAYWRERYGGGWGWSRIIRPQESLVLYKSFNTLWGEVWNGGMDHGFSSINIFSLSCLILYPMQRACGVLRESETKANASRQSQKNQCMALRVYKLMETGAGWTVGWECYIVCVTAYSGSSAFAYTIVKFEVYNTSVHPTICIGNFRSIFTM